MADKNDNVFDIKGRRAKIEQRKARQGAYTPKQNQNAGPRRGNRGASQIKLHWHHYLQFFFFLGVLAYAMTKCGA